MEEIKKSVFQFNNPRIVDLSFKSNAVFDKTKYKGIGLKFESEIYNHNDSSADVNLTVYAGVEEETVPFTMNITVTANFKWEEGINDSQVNELLNRNARVLLLSYLRPFISHLTVDAGYPPLFLPFYDFSENEVIKH